jgi:hypothetical protein
VLPLQRIRAELGLRLVIADPWRNGHFCIASHERRCAPRTSLGRIGLPGAVRGLVLLTLHFHSFSSVVGTGHSSRRWL